MTIKVLPDGSLSIMIPSHAQITFYQFVYDKPVFNIHDMFLEQEIHINQYVFMYPYFWVCHIKHI